VIAVVFIATPGPASAAPLVSISYSVTGGDFNGQFSSGPITSGAVTFTPAVPTSTPFASYQSGIWNLTLIGPSGSFLAALAASAIVFSPAHTFNIYTAAAFQPLGSVLSNGNLATTGWQFFTFGATGFTNQVRGLIPCCAPCPDCGTPGLHQFEVGSEIRTFVPEPATGALVALGLVVVGLMGGIRARSLIVGRPL
jgi:hypothetical protein